MKEFNERDFEKAIVVIVDVWYFESEELVPYLHPRMLLILESKSLKQSKASKRESKYKNSSDDDESEEEKVNKKNKKGQEKMNNFTSESDSDSKLITIF